VYPLVFESEELPFPVPGMSDVMPYESSRFSAMTAAEIDLYRAHWRRHLRQILERERPDLVHVHHAWIVAALVKDVAPTLPVVTHCHATGLRQQALCPHLAERVRRGVERNEVFLTLHRGDAKRLESALRISASRIRIVGAGYREDLFNSTGRDPVPSRRRDLLFVGKLSQSKGLPWLLDAVERLHARNREVRLHVAGGGSGPEAEALEHRMRALPDLVVVHGRLSQTELATLMRRSAVCVLPSLYEGLPLVLAEAAACGCRVVATSLAGILEALLPAIDPVLELVPLPRLETIDTPVAEDLPAFTLDIERALDRALRASRQAIENRADIDLRSLTWNAVFERVQDAWTEILD
jgi:glycosyltransferase involved in cell wall biosynthesis